MTDSPTPNSGPAAEGRDGRIDQAHELRLRADKKPLETAASPLPLQSLDQAEGQARQLAEWLQHQRSELDARANHVVTQESDLQEKVEAAQQWLEERRLELDEREQSLETRESGPDPQEIEEARARLDARESELDERQAGLDVASEHVAKERAKLGDRQARLDEQATRLATQQEQLNEASQKVVAEAREARAAADQAARLRAESELESERIAESKSDMEQRERALESRQQEIRHALERYERLGITERRLAELQEQAAHHATHERQLAQTESLLEQERASLAEAREGMARRESEWREKVEGERSQIESDRAEQRVQIKADRDRLARREEEVARREEGLRRLKGEVEATQREVLEMRLATEETWAQLTGLLAPAALTKSIARVRSQLADYYTRAQQEIAESRGSLRDAAERVAAEARALEERRVSVEEWSGRRHEELGAVAEKLMGRERELARQQQQYEKAEAHWNAERSEFRERIRDLLTELRKPGQEPNNLVDAA